MQPQALMTTLTAVEGSSERLAKRLRVEDAESVFEARGEAASVLVKVHIEKTTTGLGGG